MITGFFGFLTVGLLVFMSWRILEKAGFPGWPALTHLLTFTGIGAIAPLIFFWVLAFKRWPRDELALIGRGQAEPARTSSQAPGAIPAPTQSVPASLPTPATAAAAGLSTTWSLEGKLADGTSGRLVVDDSRPLYVVSFTDGSDVLLVPDPSVGAPHARILTAPGRIGLEDLGSDGGTWIDGVRLLPAHGARDISNSRSIRVGVVELSLARL